MSKAFEDVIQKSTLIQRKLFLLPEPHQRGTLVEIKYNTFALRREGYQVQARRSALDDSLSGMIDAFFMQGTNRQYLNAIYLLYMDGTYGHYKSIALEPTTARTNETMPPDGSWKRMLFCQPPCAYVEVTIPTVPNDVTGGMKQMFIFGEFEQSLGRVVSALGIHDEDLALAHHWQTSDNYGLCIPSMKEEDRLRLERIKEIDSDLVEYEGSQGT